MNSFSILFYTIWLTFSPSNITCPWPFWCWFFYNKTINYVFYKNDFTGEHIKISSHVYFYLMSLGKLKWKKRQITIRLNHLASYIVHQLYGLRCTLWGEDPCRLMKLIISNQSSSVNNTDEKADTQMCSLTVRYRNGQNNIKTSVTSIYDVMQDMNTSLTQYNVLYCIIHERLLLFCPSSVKSILLHCTYKHTASIIQKCIFGMSSY